MRGAVVALLLAGCSFEHGVIGGGSSDAPTGDAPLDDVAGCTPGYLDLCAQPAPMQTLTIGSADTINTDTDPRCTTLNQANGGPVCLVYATSVSIQAGGSLTATGSRPLAIASTSTLVLGGAIDVSSRRAGQRGPAASDTCMFATTPELDLGGAGGGAGGSFGAGGGNGGTGDTDTSQGNDGDAAEGTAGPIATFVALRGGCRGQAGGNEDATGGAGGAGGHGGGALYLYARQGITITGTVRATGAGAGGGAVQAGGGGGGSGGYVVIESPSITISGQISANGGGGGEGGARVGSTPVSGQPGDDGALGTTPAAGGVGTDNRFGYGGAGGAGSTGAVNGTSSIVAGGGGGGGVGRITVIGSDADLSGSLISPPPS
jgi:hypothetical protein